MQGKLKHVVTIKRPKMVKGHYLQVLIIKFSVLLNLKGYSAKSGIFFWFSANALVVIFLCVCVNYLIRASHFREFCDMVLSVRMSTYTKQSNFNGTKQVILFS